MFDLFHSRVLISTLCTPTRYLYVYSMYCSLSRFSRGHSQQTTAAHQDRGNTTCHVTLHSPSQRPLSGDAEHTGSVWALRNPGTDPYCQTVPPMAGSIYLGDRREMDEGSLSITEALNGGLQCRSSKLQNSSSLCKL